MNFYKAINGIDKPGPYMAIELFPVARKKLSPVYITGIRVFDSPDMKTYSLVIHRLRLMFGVKHSDRGEVAG